MGLILLIVPPFAVEVNAIKLLPPLDWHAPRTKSIWPPEPDMCFVPTDSAQTWPKKSTSMAAFMDIMLSFLQMTSGLFT